MDSSQFPPRKFLQVGKMCVEYLAEGIHFYSFVHQQARIENYCISFNENLQFKSLTINVMQESTRDPSAIQGHELVQVSDESTVAAAIGRLFLQEDVILVSQASSAPTVVGALLQEGDRTLSVLFSITRGGLESPLFLEELDRCVTFSWTTVSGQRLPT